jgi:hypothetical protein
MSKSILTLGINLILTLTAWGQPQPRNSYRIDTENFSKNTGTNSPTTWIKSISEKPGPKEPLFDTQGAPMKKLESKGEEGQEKGIIE